MTFFFFNQQSSSNSAKNTFLVLPVSQSLIFLLKSSSFIFYSFNSTIFYFKLYKLNVSSNFSFKSFNNFSFVLNFVLTSFLIASFILSKLLFNLYRYNSIISSTYYCALIGSFCFKYLFTSTANYSVGQFRVKQVLSG